MQKNNVFKFFKERFMLWMNPVLQPRKHRRRLHDCSGLLENVAIGTPEISHPFLIKFSSQLTVVDERRYARRQRSVFSGLWECRAVVVVVLMTCERGSRFL